MADSYMTISIVAGSYSMTQRMTACVSQQQHLGNTPSITGNASAWVTENRFLWASAPSWAEKWDYAVATHPPEPPPTDPTAAPLPPPYDPGADPACITDGDILAVVQQLGGTPA